MKKGCVQRMEEVYELIDLVGLDDYDGGFDTWIDLLCIDGLKGVMCIGLLRL